MLYIDFFPFPHTVAYPTELWIGLAFVVVIACTMAFALGRASKKMRTLNAKKEGK